MVATEDSALATQYDALAAKFTTAAANLRKGDLSDTTKSQQNADIAQLAKGVLESLEQPTDMITDWIVRISQLMAIRLFNEWGALAHIPVDGAISYAELAGKIGAEQALLSKS